MYVCCTYTITLYYIILLAGGYSSGARLVVACCVIAQHPRLGVGKAKDTV